MEAPEDDVITKAKELAHAEETQGAQGLQVKALLSSLGISATQDIAGQDKLDRLAKKRKAEKAEQKLLAKQLKMAAALPLPTGSVKISLSKNEGAISHTSVAAPQSSTTQTLLTEIEEPNVELISDTMLGED